MWSRLDMEVADDFKPTWPVARRHHAWTMRKLGYSGTTAGLESPGNLYHVRIQGDHKEILAESHGDRVSLRQRVSEAVDLHSWPLLLRCLKGNHHPRG